MFIEGRNAILESLRSDRVFKKLLVQDGINKNKKVKQIISKAKNRNIHIKYVSKGELNSTSVTGNHQGFIGIVEKRKEAKLEDFIEALYDINRDPFFIYIREAYHEHNIGAIIRSAECAGADAVILPPKIDMTAEIIRASTGASEHIHIFHESLFNAIKKCQKGALKVIGIEVSGENYYHQEDLTGPAMFIIGGEDRPLSDTVTKKCDIIVKIPLLGEINSLNMSVAASIILFDKVRQEIELASK
jgi:23S rRNA (guanosine2251-2'-O)-methyltransferase